MRMGPCAIVALAWASVAAARDASPAAHLARLQFRDIDAEDDGLATAWEFAAYGDLIMVSKDSDESGDPDEQEFKVWGLGCRTSPTLPAPARATTRRCA